MISLGDEMENKFIRIIKSIIIFLLFVIVFAAAFILVGFFKGGNVENPLTGFKESGDEKVISPSRCWLNRGRNRNKDRYPYVNKNW